MKTERIKQKHSLEWVIEFWKDAKAMSKAELMEKYKWVIEYDDLMERFINLYIENRELKDRIEKAGKVLFNKE